jgi:hypothetical protein
MHDLLMRYPEAFLLLGVVSIIALTILALGAMRTWRKHQAMKMEAELKMDMLDRGMSANEIEHVLAAKLSAAEQSTARRA